MTSPKCHAAHPMSDQCMPANASASSPFRTNEPPCNAIHAQFLQHAVPPACFSFASSPQSHTVRCFAHSRCHIDGYHYSTLNVSKNDWMARTFASCGCQGVACRFVPPGRHESRSQPRQQPVQHLPRGAGWPALLPARLPHSAAAAPASAPETPPPLWGWATGRSRGPVRWRSHTVRLGNNI